jgi:hypothetical protein
MGRIHGAALAAAVLATAFPQPAAAQQRPPDTAALLAVQREAMKQFQAMDGVWRGTAVTVRPGGEKHEITQTERIGSFLDGTVKVIEGRGYDADGKVAFNALGIVFYDPARQAFTLHSHAQGLAGDFPFRATPDGYAWEIDTRGALIRFTATIKGGELHEVGERSVNGGVPVRFFEMRLKRIGDTAWPAEGAIPPR